jgi:hypothetical protein
MAWHGMSSDCMWRWFPDMEGSCYSPHHEIRNFKVIAESYAAVITSADPDCFIGIEYHIMKLGTLRSQQNHMLLQ